MPFNLIETLMRFEILAKIHVHTPWKTIQDGGHSSQFFANKIFFLCYKGVQTSLKFFFSTLYNHVESLMRFEILTKIHGHTPLKKIQDGGHPSV